MDDLRINLSAITAEFISENSQIPPDITFRFTEDDPGEVSAHKIILAMVSEVFRNMFFVHNTLDKSATEIVMKGISRSAFQIMVDAFYNAKSVAESLRGKTLHEYFAVLYVVTKYEIPQLVLAAKKCFSSFPITEDTVLQVATDAEEYVPTFKEEAEKVLHLCAKFLDYKFTSVSSLRQFVIKNGRQFTVVHKLLVLIEEINSALGIFIANHNILQIVDICEDWQKERKLYKLLEEIGGHKILIFTETKRRCDELTRLMRKDGWPAMCIHEDKEQKEKDWVLNEFKKGSMPILVATDEGARVLDVLDVDDIKFVINYDCPNNIEDYLNRIGRTGRKGRSGTSYTLFTEKNALKAKDLVKVLVEAKQVVNPKLQEMAEGGRGGGRGGGRW